MIDHAAITKWMHSRATLVISGVVAVCCALLSYVLTGAQVDFTSKGFVSGWSFPTSPIPEVQWGVATALNVAIVALILYINKAFNLLRTMTHLNAAVFLVMQLATPLVLYALCSGSLLALVLLMCISAMYTLYDQMPCDTRRIFLIFAVLSGCSSFDYAYAIYIPVFVLACVQMRAMSVRAVSALVMGIFTPWIMLMGFGIVHPSQLQMPYIALSLSAFANPRYVLIVTVVLITSSVAIVSLLRNALKFIAYNAQSRSRISVMTITTIVSIIASLVDMAYFYGFIVILNVCAAFQFTHAFTAFHNHGRSWIFAVMLLVVYLFLFAFSFLV